MGRLVFFTLCLAGAWLFMTNRISIASLDPRSVGTVVEGRRVTRTADQVEAEFYRLGGVSETYMLFGGDAQQRRNQIYHAHLAGLPLPDARALASRYPDFHLCASPGAAEAKRRVTSMNFLAADRASRATLVRAHALFQERLRAGGERTCLRIRGAELALEDARILDAPEVDFPHEARAALARSPTVLVEEAAIEDCAALLH